MLHALKFCVYLYYKTNKQGNKQKIGDSKNESTNLSRKNRKNS